MKEIHVTFKRFLFFGLMTLALGLNAQTVTLKFTGRDIDNRYVRLNKVVVNNLTKNWQETIWWPDTTLMMQNATGIEDYVEDGGFALSQNNPNPFSGTTEVSLNVAEEGQIHLKIADVNGREMVETQNFASLQPGLHQFRISLSTAGTYVMTARQNGKTSSIKMICNGGGGTNAIDYLGETQSITYTLKSTTNKPFNYGDMMEYIGYATFNGSQVESQRITQAQGTSQTFTLQFTVAQSPNAPTGVAATVSGTQIHITWNSVSNATSYKVYRCSSANGSYTQIGSPTSNNYYDTNPLTGNNYYKVKAVNSAGESAYSSVASCNYVTVPEVTTNTTVNNVTSSTATCGGNVSSDGGATVTSRGVCWGTSPNPTVSAHTSNGSGTGLFSSNMTGLAANTMYYVRAYATNSAGTNYGAQTTFTTTAFTCGSNTTDYDGNSYNTVQIGSQCWMKENLKATNLNNATPISLIQDSTTWASTSSAAYCYYNISSYGCLYNFYAVSSGLLCPPGWHVPSSNEVFGTLYSSLGGTDVGGKMKITGTTYWQSPNTGATNSSEFSARGGGCRPEGMSFYRINTHAVFWTTTNYEDNADYVKTYCMSYNSAALMNYGYSNYGYSMSKKSGLSVRCLREESAPSSPCDAADQCTYTFNLTDSYGDGWNGGVLSVQQNGVTVASITLSEGSSGTETVNLCNNISTSLLWTPGSYVSEVGFSIQDPSGNEVYSITGMSNYSTYTFIPSCSEIIVPASGSTTITTCNSWIYDNGGSTGDYQNNSDGYIVVTPATTGQGISLEGTYDVESYFDHIYVYAGVGTSGTQLGSYSGSGTISLTNNGTVTIRFTSDNSVVNPGFAIHATCASATAPSAPTGVTATVSGSQIYISWNSVSNATSYKVYRSSSSSGTYSQIGSATSNTYLYDSNPLTGYNYYKVKAENSAGESAYSSVASCNYVTAPSAPTGITATVSGSQIYISWNSVSNATSYKVYRSSSASGTYSQIGSATSNTYLYDSNPLTGYNYYKIKAVNSAGESSYSSYASCNYTGGTTVPSAPTGVTATVSGSQIYISWNSVSNATSYKVYWSSSANGSYGLIGTSTSCYYYDNAPVSGYNYYKIKAVNSAGESDYSTYDYVYYSGGATVPDAPTGVTATNVGTSSSPQIEISWYPVSDATSYKVYRSSSASGTYSLLGSTSYTYKYDNNPLSGHNYYKVKAVNAAGESSYSSYAHYNNTGGGGSTTYAPCPPTISVSGTSSQTVSWTPVINSGCGTPTSYEVYHRDPCNNGTYVLMTTTTSTTYHVSSSNVHPGINRYAVKAINSNGSVSNYAASSSVSLSAPSSFTVQKLSGGYLKFTWSAVSKATGYQIFVSDSPSPNSGYMIMSNGWINDGSTTTATIYYPETSGTTRYFKMKAFYDCGDYWELSNLTSTYESITF